MLEIIHSRVVCTPSDVGEGIQNEISNRFAGNGTSLLFDERRNISGTSNYSPSNLSAFSRRLYADEAITPDLRNRAILETEKWFQEKGLSPSLKFVQECGPCVLNTELWWFTN
ncbi:hypothetical protein AXF42_Ash017370 [Apostasia shenzhenica]|uniref:Uncharacterized protein n=1 Tax=Apostasia shenzhenica TaxID=1088818 RepID=A0A2I0BDI3_9ASPA|nr:hypothetical protein AXF42_Ash017370 [Apostasia shenzhenica]